MKNLKLYNPGDVINISAEPSKELTAAEIQQRYESGKVAGCWYDGEQHDKFRELAKASGGYSDYGDAAHAFGIAGSFAGKLVLPWLNAMALMMNCFPGAAQARGDCVSHGTRTAIFMAMVGDIVSGIADSVTGLLEGVPADLTTAGILDLPLSSESLWWWRGYSGDGWDVDSAMNVALQHGILLRKNYPDLGFDLTNYSYANTALYGGRSPSAAIDAEQQKHKPVTAADASSFEEIQDALGNLHGVTSDGGEAWSSSRDQYGYSPQSGRWSHDFPQIGTDSRKEIVAIFGEPLVLNINNWAKWNSGPRDVYMSAHLVPPQFKERWIKLGLVNPATGNILIPEGAWWAKWSSMKNRQFKVAAGFRGWAKKPLANLGATGLI